MPLIYLVAGEASGDALGARLMAALRATRPDLEFSGIGGPRMESEGLTSLFSIRELAVMGLVEVLPRLRQLRARLREAATDIAMRRPDIVVTIDSPGFGLRLLRAIRPLGIPHVHYVAPQVWAWRERRARHFPGLWDKLLCLLPFEPEFFARHGLPAHFVGHPVLESGADQGNSARFRASHGLAVDAKVLVLMPGSRRSEAPRLLPVFGATVAALANRIPGIVPVIPTSPAVADVVLQSSRSWPVPPILVTELGDKHDAYAAAAAALTKSGTSTLELALAGVPMAVTYRVNPITAAIARRLISVPHVAMVNLLAGKEIVPELLQTACTPAGLSDTVFRLINDPELGTNQRLEFKHVLEKLRPPFGLPSAAAAREVLDLVQET